MACLMQPQRICRPRPRCPYKNPRRRRRRHREPRRRVDLGTLAGDGGRPLIMRYFEATADPARAMRAPLLLSIREPPPGEVGNVGSQPPPSALKSCTRFSDTFVVLVAHCCSACSSVRSASSSVRKSPTPSL